MPELSELFKRLLFERKMRIVDLARLIHADLSLVTTWVNGAATPTPDILDKIAQALHVDKQWFRSHINKSSISESKIKFLDKQGLTEKQGVLLPFLGRTWCKDGFWCELHNERAMILVEENRKIADNPARYFLIESLGDRIEDYGINDDDILLCCFQDTANSGDIVVALCSDEYITIKEYWALPDQTPVLRGNRKRVWYEGIQILSIQGKLLGKVKGRRIV